MILVSFPDAVRVMLRYTGACCRRASWRDDKTIINVFPEGKLPYFEIRTKEGDAPYVPSQCDMRATDWEVFYEK